MRALQQVVTVFSWFGQIRKVKSASKWCEWKGQAGYYSITVDDRQAPNAAWFYPEAQQAYAALRNHVAFYRRQMDARYVDGKKVWTQPGDLYGGWITSDVVGSFKGGAGTVGW